MGNQNNDLVNCEVLRAIGVPATPADIKHLKQRAERRGLKFTDEGLTTMIQPNKPVYNKETKTYMPGEAVFAKLSRDVARKLNNAGAVRVVI